MRSLIAIRPNMMGKSQEGLPLGSFAGHLPLWVLKDTPGNSWFRLSHHKHWIYLCLLADPLIVSIAILDLTYIIQVFVFIYNQSTQKVEVEISEIATPWRGGVKTSANLERMAWFHGSDFSLSIHGNLTEERYQVSLQGKNLSLEAELQGSQSPAPISAISISRPSGIHLTEKSALLDLRGNVLLEGQTYSLNHGTAGIDYTHGYLPRTMDWYWAFAMGHTTTGERIGINLIEGGLNEAECALWVGDDLIPLAKGTFLFSKEHPEHLWRIRSQEGVLDLQFQPFALHREWKQLLIAASSYVQAVGSFQGTITLPNRATLEVGNVLGVTEDQHVVW